MKKQELVKDLKCSDDDFKYCETCKVFESKRLPAVRKENIKAREFGEVITIDIDVMPCESVKVTIIDWMPQIMGVHVYGRLD